MTDDQFVAAFKERKARPFKLPKEEPNERPLPAKEPKQPVKVPEREKIPA